MWVIFLWICFIVYFFVEKEWRLNKFNIIIINDESILYYVSLYKKFKIYEGLVSICIVNLVYFLFLFGVNGCCCLLGECDEKEWMIFLDLYFVGV